MSGACNELPITIIKGRDFALNIRALDVDGAPIDFTGFTITSRCKTDFGGDTIFDFGVTIVNAVNGEFDLTLTDAVTGVIAQTRGIYDVKADDGSSNTLTLFQGLAVFRESITP
jgi:hypothetical protein